MVKVSYEIFLLLAHKQEPHSVEEILKSSTLMFTKYSGGLKVKRMVDYIMLSSHTVMRLTVT
jgi:hypothetical protein